jgi:replicative DNA helicase
MLTIGWERAAIGTALADPSVMSEATDLLPSDYTGAHQIIWAEMLALHRRSALELRSLIEALRSGGQLDEIGSSDVESTGEAYIAELLAHRGDAMGEYVDRVLGASIKRQLRRTAALIAAEADDDLVDPEEALDSAERRIITLRRSRLTSMGATFADLIGVFSDRLQGFRDGTIKPAWEPKIDAVKAVIDFVEEKDFLINAARPGEGKSSSMRFDFIRTALEGMPVTLFNLENGELEYARYAIALLTGIDSARLRNPRGLSDQELQSVRDAGERLARAPLYVVTLGAPSVRMINRKYTASSGERVQETEWVNCEAWGKLAEICNEYLRKGRKVLVVGRVKTDTYEKDGKKEHFRKVVLSEMEMLDNGDRGEQEGEEEETVAAPW